MMRLLDHELQILYALTTREILLMGHMDTKGMDADRLVDHYRLFGNLKNIEQKLTFSLRKRQAKIRDAAAAASDATQPS